jgi:hypothetical protein
MPIVWITNQHWLHCRACGTPRSAINLQAALGCPSGGLHRFLKGWGGRQIHRWRLDVRLLSLFSFKTLKR